MRKALLIFALIAFASTAFAQPVIQRGTAVGGILCSNATSAATTGTAEEVLATCTLPANTLSADLKAIRVTAVFESAANGNTKVAKILFGGIVGGQVATLSSAGNATGYCLVGEILRTASNAQIGQGRGMAANILSSTIPVAMTKTDTAPIDIVATGTTGTAAGDLTFKYMLVEVLN